MSIPPSTRPSTLLDPQGNLLPQALGSYAFRGDYTGTNLIYKGYAKIGADTGASVWQIAFLTYDGANNVVSIQWPINANGQVSGDFEFVWNNRAAYTYV